MFPFIWAFLSYSNRLMAYQSLFKLHLLKCVKLCAMRLIRLRLTNLKLVFQRPVSPHSTIVSFQTPLTNALAVSTVAGLTQMKVTDVVTGYEQATPCILS